MEGISVTPRPDYSSLPKDWLMAHLPMLRAAEMKSCVAQAVVWGFDEPKGLSNQWKRQKWLEECREIAWNILAYGEPFPEPGMAQPKKAQKPNRLASLPEKVAPKRSQCGITAAEVNKWLRSLPVCQPSI